MNDGLFTPSEVIQKLGIAPSTLRRHAAHFKHYLSNGAKEHPRLYSDADLEVLERTYSYGKDKKSFNEIEVILGGVSSNSDVSKEGFSDIIFDDKKVPEDINWREYIELASLNQDVDERADDHNKIASVGIDTKKPIGIMYSSDWHLGDAGTDHKSWSADMDRMISCPYLYMVDLGDDRQNVRSFRDLSAVLNQSLSPKQQARLVKSLIDELTDKNKLIAKVDGNHDVEFDERILGEALQTYLLTKMKAPRFSNRGVLKLRVGNQVYTNLLFHKSRFSSFLRAAHGAMREHQLSFPADIVAGGHNHSPSFEIFWRYELARKAGYDFGGEIFLIKTGSYQDNGYGWKYFHGGSTGNPTVVLFPNEHKKLIFMRPEDAIDYLSLYY